jgi:hypothetical protein
MTDNTVTVASNEEDKDKKESKSVKPKDPPSKPGAKEKQSQNEETVVGYHD